MKTVTKEMYKCDHCAKWYHRKHAATIHEKACKKNPANKRPCFDCVHLDYKHKTVYDDHPYAGEIETTLKLLHCSKFNAFIYPPTVGAKGNAFDLGDDDNVEMPIECNGFKSHMDIEWPFGNNSAI